MNQNPFDFGYVFSTADYVWGPYSTIFFIVFLIGAIVSNLVFFVFKYRFKNNLLTYTLVNRASRNAAIAFSLGVFFFLSRIALLQPFNARVFLDISALLLLYYIIRGVLYMFRTYPKAKAEWQARQARENRKNEPRAAAAAAPIRPATSVKANGTATTTAATTPVKAAPAKVATTAGTVATDTNVISPATEVRGLSERGQKRRERKRSKR
ncbi:MAG: hypothetical protein J0I20_19105 [Chloroflexi bacterium]|nr:hypothetical protein [Chloroflexota bacterium]OJW00817.1 MAG: hypothetical protein BGO39_20490 [Chloroflexi bacterium 54-19]